MQSQDKHFAGHKNPDTQSFDDSQLLSKFYGAPHKIQQLNIVHNNNSVVGIQAVYRVLGWNQVVEGGKHFGGNHGSAKTTTLNLNDDEYITEISGRAGNIIDHLKITTNTGKTLEVGGQGGNPFTLHAPYGRHFATLRGGLGGDLHLLDLVAEPLPQFGGFQSFQPQQDQFYRGKKHGDTKAFSDRDLLKAYGGQHKIKTLHVYHDGKSIIGLQADYYIYGQYQTIQGPKHAGTEHAGNHGQVQLEDDEFITEIYGRHGDILDFIGFKTNKGNSAEFGGPGGHVKFEIKAPYGRHFAIVQGGLGGHIHNIDFAVEPIYKPYPKQQHGEFKKGKTHGDTVSFNDADLLKNYPPTHKIWKITVFHDKKFVHGFQANYFVFGPNVVVEGPKHVGKEWKDGQDVVELSADEYITEVFGRHGDIMDNFGFATNRGRRFEFGGSGGNHFEAKAPHGYHFGTLGGGIGGHLHNVEWGLAPLHQAPTKWF